MERGNLAERRGQIERGETAPFGGVAEKYRVDLDELAARLGDVEITSKTDGGAGSVAN